ncbi:velvet factor-domain-containing protein [Xylariales sp. PMI_506]|nr:velvet factor-domain-containing protein [Xylariales sp. PMI_506]
MNHGGHQGLWAPGMQATYSPPGEMQSQQSFSPRSRYHGFHLIMKQQPEHGRVAHGKEKDRKPIDPPPFIELRVENNNSVDGRLFMSSPYLILQAILEPAPGTTIKGHTTRTVNSLLMGTTVASVNRLKDEGNNDIGIFVFPDLTVKSTGLFVLRFVLLNMEESGDLASPGDWVTVCECYSQTFTVHNQRNFPGLAESTPLTRSFADQGVRVRVRKDSRALTTRKQNNGLASIAHRKRDREEIYTKQAEPEVHQSPVPGHHRYYKSQTSSFDSQDSKRHRGDAGPNQPYTMHGNLGPSTAYSMMPISSTYAAASAPLAHGTVFFTSDQTQQSLMTPNYHNRSIFPQQSFAPSHLSQVRNGATRLDTQGASLYSGDGLMDPSPGRHSPGTQFGFPNSPSQASPSLINGVHGQQNFGVTYFPTDGLPRMNESAITTSPIPNSHMHATPVSSTGSPVDGNAYILAPTPYTAASGYMNQTSGHYDQATLRTQSMSTRMPGEISHSSLRANSMNNQAFGRGVGLIHGTSTSQGGV